MPIKKLNSHVTQFGCGFASCGGFLGTKSKEEDSLGTSRLHHGTWREGLGGLELNIDVATELLDL